jgi:2,5-diketo-D-gluconate reductase A
MSSTALAPTVELVHGAQMPRLGLGTSPMDSADAEAAVTSAIGLGYRLIDTAHAYGNEEGVGRGLRTSGVPREELFVTSKLNAEWHGFQEAQDAFAMSAERLGVDYLDLFLIHWPNPRQDRYVDAFRGLIELLRTGRVRAIGLSNFKPEHVQRVIDETGAVPDVNQIELDPTVAREESRAYHRRHDIVTESWSPLGGDGGVLREPAITAIAEKHGRTPAQVVLRWNVQIGAVPIPKSATPARQAENLAVFDFELDDDDMAALAALDRGESAATDSDSFGH